MKIHMDGESKMIYEGAIAQITWLDLRPDLNRAFHVKSNEVIADIEPNQYGIKVKIKKI